MYNRKIIDTITHIEIWDYNKIIFEKSDYKLQIESDKTIKRTKFEDMNVLEKNKAIQRRIKNQKEVVHTIRRLIDTNLFNPYNKYKSLFVTLTFEKERKELKKIINDLDKVKYEFKKFIKRFNYKRKCKVKYLAIFEKHKNGGYHIHCIFFDIMTDTTEIFNSWKNGKIDIEVIYDNSPKIASYMTKYLTKEFDNIDLNNLEHLNNYNKKNYLKSNNLLKPFGKKYIINENDNCDNYKKLELINENEYTRTYIKDGVNCKQICKYKKYKK
ncbi:hypothetical protein OKW22_000873 [Bacilli bacterium PM5-3]|nr:hypothetical protein [Bacilli bacterium PM5-3]